MDSYKNKKINVIINHLSSSQENSNFDFKQTGKVEKEENLVVPIEEYISELPFDYNEAIKNYNIEQFPELFNTKSPKDDVETIVPELKMTKPTRLLTALYETNIIIAIKKRKNKIFN